MAEELTPEMSQRHNLVYRQGWALIRGEIAIAGSGVGSKTRLGWFGRRRLRQAIKCFEAALQIAPSNWSALWALGKIYQRLGDFKEALAYFARAHQMKPDQPDVAREAGICATHLGDGPSAVRYCESAIACAPNDAGLVANLALACLINGDLDRAQVLASEACAREPGDAVSKNVQRIVHEVAIGKRAQPKYGRDFGM